MVTGMFTLQTEEAPPSLRRSTSAATPLEILVVEDQPGDVILIREALAEAPGIDCRSTTVDRLGQARALLRDRSFDLVLLDLSLPDSSGIGTLEGVASRAGDTPILVLTGYDDIDLEIELVRRGVQEYLLKHEISAQSLGRAVRHGIERGRILVAQRRAEAAARQSETDLRALIEATPEAIFVHRHGLLQYVNPGALRLLGARTRDEMLGKPILDFIHGEDRDLASEMIERATLLEGGTEPPRELRLERGDGCVLVTEATMLPVAFGDRGELDPGCSVLLVANDRTGPRRVQARAIQADRAAAMGVLAAGMAHEINNPLSYVIGNLDYLDDELPALMARFEALAEAGEAEGVGSKGLREGVQAAIDRWADIRETIADAREGADRVRALVADLKILSRAGEGSAARADVETILETVLRLMGGELRGHARITRCYEAVDEVAADPARLAQVFLGLLANAVQALPDQRSASNLIELAIQAEGPGFVRIDICDNGVGIPTHLASRVFDPFFTTKAPGKGAGLGLTICRHIIDELGGEISAERRQPQGTRVRVLLPTSGGVRVPDAALR